MQTIVNEALENGLALYEKRHPRAKGLIQGSVVVLRNADAAILAEAGGRQVYEDRDARYSDLNRVTGSLRQPGSAWKPLVYLAAFRQGLNLDTTVPDEPIDVPMGDGRDVKWIANYDNQFKGPIPVRQALAESRNAVAVWITREIGLDQVIRTARELGIRTPLQPYVTTALGASEVRLLELAGAYRAMASGVLAEPHVIDRVTDASGGVLYEAAPPAREIRSAELSLIQEGLRGVVRLPDGTAHGLDGRDFPIPVMGKTGTTSDFRDALFVGSTYGPQGITVAVRIGFDDNRELGREGDRRARGAADLPRDHAPRLPGQAGGAGAEVPPRDRGGDRQVPGAAGEGRRTANAGRRRCHGPGTCRPGGDGLERPPGPLLLTIRGVPAAGRSRTFLRDGLTAVLMKSRSDVLTASSSLASRLLMQVLVPFPIVGNRRRKGRVMTMSLTGLIVLIIIAAVCGAIGKALAGGTRGGLLVSIVLGFIGALLGPWVAGQLKLPEPLVIHLSGHPFPVLWSIIGAALFVAFIHLISGRR